MAGHSKWANIKHKKAKEDAKKGKIFTKLIKEITVAAKQGGDPASNPRLRLLLEKAKQENMPAENATRAIKKGTGELPGVHYDPMMYEGFGPGGIAILVETLSDNKNRIVAEMRTTFSRGGGNLGEANTVNWMFEKKGVIRMPDTGVSEDELIEKLLDYKLSDNDASLLASRLIELPVNIPSSLFFQIKQGDNFVPYFFIGIIQKEVVPSWLRLPFI